jgi:hypothetical protein
MTEECDDTDRSPEGDAERDDAPDERRHLSEVAAGAGCTEIWEHLSETRDGACQD